MRETMIVGREFHVVGVVQQHTTRPQRTNVRFVAVLIKRHQHVGTIAGGKDVAGPHAYLKDRWTARNRGRDRHVRHYVLVAAAGESGEKTADRLDAVLRVTGEADDNVFK